LNGKKEEEGVHEKLDCIFNRNRLLVYYRITSASIPCNVYDRWFDICIVGCSCADKEKEIGGIWI
jgi:hypothetical protein